MSLFENLFGSLDSASAPSSLFSRDKHKPLSDRKRKSKGSPQDTDIVDRRESTSAAGNDGDKSTRGKKARSVGAEGKLGDGVSPKKKRKTSAANADLALAEGGSAETPLPPTSGDVPHLTGALPEPRSQPASRTKTAGKKSQLDSTTASDAEDGAADTSAAPSASVLHSFTPEQLQRTVFVGNVPPMVQHKLQKALTAHFAGCGKVESVRIRNMPVQLDSKMPKHLQVKAGKINAERATAIAYVRFDSAAALPAALELNMSMFSGNHLRVDVAVEPSKQSGAAHFDPKLSVFVGNLSFSVLEEDIISVFNSGEFEPQLAGSVRGVRIVRDANSNLGKGFAYVLFGSRTAALAAIGMDGRECKGRPMRVTRVKASLATKGPAKPTSSGKASHGQPGALRGKSGAKPAPADWQGLKTRGKGAALKPKGGVAKAKASKDGANALTGAIRKNGKRPAVLARKAQALAASGKLTPTQAKAAKANAVASAKKNKRKLARKGAKAAV